MSAIDELKNGGIMIDTLAGEDSADIEADLSAGISIDTTSENAKNVVDLSGLNTGVRSKRVILPSDKPTSSQSSQRKTVSIDTIAENSDEEDEDIHESLQKDLLDMDNPNSVFSQYLSEKTAEAKEYIADLEEKKATEEAEAAEDEALSEDEIEDDDEVKSSLVFDDYEDEEDSEDEVSYTTSTINPTDIDTEDISDMIEEEDNIEEEDMNQEETMIDSVDDLIPTEEEIDAESVPVEEEVAEEKEELDILEDEDIEAEDTVVEEKKEEAPAEPERYDVPEGIEADVENSDESLATEVVEEEESVAAANNTDDEILKNLQKLATEKLKPVSKSLDISSFTILKKPVTNISTVFEAQKARVAKWVLPNQGSIVLMKEFSGSELERLREYSEDNRSLDMLNRRFHLIYDHIASPKPQSFEQWLRTTPYEDVDNYFFAVYIASFKGANYLPADCVNPDCKETFLSEDIKVMDMVKFENKEAQKKFAELYQSEPTAAGKGIYCTEVVPVSNNIAVSFREPSIYNIFELAGLDDRTRDKYSNLLEYIPYIDTVYVIDQTNQTLAPITYKMYPDNANKTVRSKIQKYDNIFNTLTIDEFGTIKAYVAAIAQKTQDMYYVYPSLACPKCGNMTEETRATAESLVFTRYQLGALVNTTLN